MKGKIFNAQKLDSNVSTSTNAKPQTCSLKIISEAMKKLAMLPDTKEEDKILGIESAAFKFNQPENYRKMSDEDKALIENAIQRAAYIIREDRLKRTNRMI